QAGKFGDNRDASEHFLRLHEITSQGAGVPENKAHYTVGPWLTFDPHTEKFTGAHAAAANPLVQDPHNPGFEIPSLKNV
ncbi:MAG: gfo/Idh/MocA family oxidoreductase, partial [Planctomycetales bacterium]|nr:gfo/Idh/MocA family oxidoreductase [Planctomycetales bacterium]NIP68929.1 gfo/Idh/MocA family oxidoreductase [Planctomycetales bacterium]